MLSALALLICASQGNRIPVSVRVVDVDGKPVPSVPVAQQWLPKMPEMTLPLIPMDALYTNQEGVAQGSVEGDYPLVLTTFDEKNHLGGFVSITKGLKDPVIRMT